MTSYARANRVLSESGARFLDGLLVVYGFITMYGIRASLDRSGGLRAMVDLWPGGQIPFLAAPLSAYWWLILLAALYWPMVLDWQEFYRHPLQLSLRRAAVICAKATGIILMAILAVLFLLRLHWVNRTYVIGASLWSALLILGRHVVQSFFVRRRARENVMDGYPVLLVAARDDTAALVRWLRGHPEEYFVPVGIILTDPEGPPGGGASLEGLPVCGTVADLVRALHDFNVSSVIIGSTSLSLDMVRQIVLVCEVEGVDAWLMADFVKTQHARAVSGSMGGRAGLLFTSGTGTEWQKAVKRILDVIGSAILIVVLSPLMLVLAVLVKCTSPGPVLFRQARAGLHGRPFMMVKFRSMVCGSERDHARLKEMNEMEGPVFKISGDPRMTPLGRVLRRWSLDELPQLFNVLFGHMSLVGPRPLPTYEVDQFFNLAHRRRMSMKPGLTCLWQISGRNTIRDFDEWVRLDLEYIDHWSLWLDLKILARTPWIVLQGSGV